jgi:hypothetical protein
LQNTCDIALKVEVNVYAKEIGSLGNNKWEWKNVVQKLEPRGGITFPALIPSLISEYKIIKVTPM